MTAGRAPASPGREQPGTARTAVPGVPAAPQPDEAADRLAAELPCEVTPDPARPGLYEAKWESGIVIATAADLREFFHADNPAG